MRRSGWVVGLSLALAVSAGAAPGPEGVAPFRTGPDAKGPLRVLLLTSAGGREFQILQRLLLRQADARRVDLTVHIQPPPGRVVTVNKVEGGFPRRLSRFPDQFKDSSARPDTKPFDLSGYEVVVAMDAHWEGLSPAQRANLRRWVEKGGGLVLIAGHIHTSRLGGDSKALADIRELLPVVIDDRPEKRDTRRPWRLQFPGRRPAYLQLDSAGKGPLAGWEEFFRDGTAKPEKPGEPPHRGFYWCQAVRAPKAGTQVIATFTDPVARLAGGKDRPFLVQGMAGSGRVIYLGSAELWRLAAFRAPFHERIWLGMLQEAARRRMP